MSRSHNEYRVPPRYRRISRRKSWTERRYRKREERKFNREQAQREIEEAQDGDDGT